MEATVFRPIVVGLLFVTAISAIVSKRVRFPNTIDLVLVGIAN